jgi:hypothetical protein
MDGLVSTVGNGIASLIAAAFGAIGGALRAIVSSANSALPGGSLAMVAFAALLVLAWILAKR